MKIRTGFVSNSSSSSFIVSIDNFAQDDPKLLKEYNKKKYLEYNEYYEEDDEYDRNSLNELLDKYKDKRIITIQSIEYGAEEDVERIVKEIVQSLVDPKTKVYFDWEEC